MKTEQECKDEIATALSVITMACNTANIALFPKTLKGSGKLIVAILDKETGKEYAMIEQKEP